MHFFNNLEGVCTEIDHPAALIEELTANAHSSACTPERTVFAPLHPRRHPLPGVGNREKRWVCEAPVTIAGPLRSIHPLGVL